MKKASLLLFGIVWCSILAVITWLFSCSSGVGKSDFPDPYGRWMMYTFFSGFWALGVVVVASGIAMLFSKRDEKPRPGSLMGKFFFIILGAMFALLGVFGVCGTVADNAGVDDPDLPMFFRVFALVMHNVLPVVMFVIFFLIGIMVFLIGINELARPLRKKKAAVRGKRTVRLRRTPDLDVVKLLGSFLGCMAAIGLIIGLKSFQIFTNPFAFKCFLIVSPVAVIGTYAAFVVRMVRREAALPHYKVTFTGGKWRTGAEMSVRYEFAGASAPDALKVLLVQSDGAIRDMNAPDEDWQETVYEVDSPAAVHAGSFAFTVPKAISSEHIRWGLVFLFNCEGRESEDYFKLPAK
jgi:hypothetical protein